MIGPRPQQADRGAAAMTSELDAFRTGRDRLASLLGTPKDSTEQFVRVAAAGTAGPVPALVNAGGDAIITNGGIRVVNGAIEVRNAGATVIIDGTSDMFKIQCGGTVSVAWPSTVNTGLEDGAWIAVDLIDPGRCNAVVMAGAATADVSQWRASAYRELNADNTLSWEFQAFTQVYASLHPGMQYVALKLNTGNKTWTNPAQLRYYILREAGI